MNSFSCRRSIGIAAVLAAIGALLLALLGPVQSAHAYPFHRAQLVASAQASAGTVEALIAQCPSSAEVAAFNTDLSITFEADPTAGTLVCQASNGLADLTRLQERTYQALRVMKAIHFSRPLPWTSQNLYDWFVSSIHGIRFRSDIPTSYCCDAGNVLNILVTSNSAELATNRWIDPSSRVGLEGLVELLVHEARHTSKLHTCGSDDQTVGELGAWGVQYYLNLWEGLYSGSFLTSPDPYPSFYRDYALGNSESLLSRFCSLPTADLSLAIGAPSVAVRGQSIIYTFTVANSGPDPAPDVFLYSPVPVGTTYVGATTSNGSCSADSGGPIACAFGSLAAGTSVTAKVTLLIDPASIVSQITNKESLTADGARVTSPSADPDTANNFASFSTPVVQPPTASVTTPADGASYTLGQVVNASYSCQDGAGGPGIRSCTGTVANGAAIDTSTVGVHSFSVTATSLDGLTATTTAHYTVDYAISGFLPPVDNPPTVNTLNAGRAVPVKFSLTGDQGLDIFQSGYPSSSSYTCSSSAPTDAIEQTVTAGGSSLSYDPAADQYTYVWKTDKTWAGTCRVLVVKLKDNTTHTANFQFTR